jgi:F-box interacting protein
MDSEETKTKKKQKQQCIINCLPGDLIEQIFLGLPVSSLLRCIEVCKQWHKVIRDPKFITAHLELAPRCALIFSPQKSIQGKAYPSDAIIFDEASSHSSLAVPVIGPDDFLCGSCNGLLCLYTKKSSTIKIANLATGECLRLDKPIKNLKGDHFSFYRFAFHPITKEYKVTHFLDENQNYSRGTFSIIQVYTLGSDRWKDVKSSEALSLSCVKNSGVVSVDGSMLWLTEDTGASWKHAVISFDLNEESFARIQLPEVSLGGYRRYWITEINGKVCIATGEVHKHQPKMLADKLQVWTLDNMVDQRWSQTHSISCAHNYLPGPHFVHGDKIMMQDISCNLYFYELFGKNCGTMSSNMVKPLSLKPHKPDNMQSYICVKSLVRLEAYKKVGIVQGSKHQEGWNLKKWEAWERDISNVEGAWKKCYELEKNSLVCCTNYYKEYLPFLNLYKSPSPL